MLGYFLLLIFVGLINFYFSLQILRRIAATQVKIGFIEIRWQVHRHMKQYCRLTRAETGRIGSAFYGYWLSLAAMLACAGLLLAELPWTSLPH